MTTDTLDQLRNSVAISGELPVVYLEKHLDLVGALELRKLIPIQPLAEQLVPIDGSCSFFAPHRYVAAGAPYGAHGPFFLREGVAKLLHQAQQVLKQELPGARLKVFDGFRPKAVQIYMRDFEFRNHAGKLGLNLDSIGAAESAQVWELVDAVWARPSDDPQLPTPHSTGAAVDITIVDARGQDISMGSEIDESSPKSLPSYYQRGEEPDARRYSENRELLRRIMEGVGFHRLSHEWWHFSYGDQFWALLESLRAGRLVHAWYGEYL